MPEPQAQDLFVTAERQMAPASLEAPRDLPCDAAHPPKFDGETYEKPLDEARLTGQCLAVFTLMSDEQPRTLAQIASAVGCSEASASARLRDFRKDRFGKHDVERVRLEGGLFTYRLVVNKRLPLASDAK